MPVGRKRVVEPLRAERQRERTEKKNRRLQAKERRAIKNLNILISGNEQGTGNRTGTESTEGLRRAQEIKEAIKNRRIPDFGTQFTADFLPGTISEEKRREFINRFSTDQGVQSFRKFDRAQDRGGSSKRTAGTRARVNARKSGASREEQLAAERQAVAEKGGLGDRFRGQFDAALDRQKAGFVDTEEGPRKVSQFDRRVRVINESTGGVSFERDPKTGEFFQPQADADVVSPRRNRQAIRRFGRGEAFERMQREPNFTTLEGEAVRVGPASFMQPQKRTAQKRTDLGMFPSVRAAQEGPPRARGETTSQDVINAIEGKGTFASGLAKAGESLGEANIAAREGFTKQLFGQSPTKAREAITKAGKKVAPLVATVQPLGMDREERIEGIEQFSRTLGGAVEGFLKDFRDKPVTNALLFGAGALVSKVAVPLIKVGSGKLFLKAAPALTVAQQKGVLTTGKIIGKATEAGLISSVAISTGISASQKETPEERGAVVGKTAARVTSFVAGGFAGQRLPGKGIQREAEFTGARIEQLRNINRFRSGRFEIGAARQAQKLKVSQRELQPFQTRQFRTLTPSQQDKIGKFISKGGRVTFGSSAQRSFEQKGIRFLETGTITRTPSGKIAGKPRVTKDIDVAGRFGSTARTTKQITKITGGKLKADVKSISRLKGSGLSRRPVKVDVIGSRGQRIGKAKIISPREQIARKAVGASTVRVDPSTGQPSFFRAPKDVPDLVTTGRVIAAKGKSPFLGRPRPVVKARLIRNIKGIESFKPVKNPTTVSADRLPATAESPQVFKDVASSISSSSGVSAVSAVGSAAALNTQTKRPQRMGSKEVRQGSSISGSGSSSPSFVSSPSFSRTPVPFPSSSSPSPSPSPPSSPSPSPSPPSSIVPSPSPPSSPSPSPSPPSSIVPSPSPRPPSSVVSSPSTSITSTITTPTTTPTFFGFLTKPAGGDRPSLTVRRVGKRKSARTPTLFSSGFGVFGKQSSIGIKSGLGIRPIELKKKKKGEARII